MIEIIEPTLLLDKHKALTNLQKMKDKADANNLIFRPHFKTHQSLAIGRWYREFGITAITVSSLKMAEYFAQDGWDDITVAFPVNLLERSRIERLCQRISLNVIVESRKTLSVMEKWDVSGLNVMVEIDAGYHRTGVPFSQLEEIDHMVNMLKGSPMIFKGFLIHNGHTYAARSKDQISAMHKEAVDKLQPLLNRYPQALFSLGDTPSFSTVSNLEGFGEMRPGNFIFYDLAQWQIGSCDQEHIAVCMACPVVAKYPDRNELVVYGGAVHLSKDSMNWEGKTIFGLPVGLERDGWQDHDGQSYVKSLSQEHGIVRCSRELLDSVDRGDLLGILPVHSCLTGQSAGSYLTLEGERLDHM